MQKYKEMTGRRYAEPSIGPQISLSDMFDKCFKPKCVEPVQRMVGGQFGYASHRFAIKGGITRGQLIAENLVANNALLQRIMAKK